MIRKTFFFLLFFLTFFATAEHLEIHFVDVGQGDGIVLRTDSAVVVVDSGMGVTMTRYLENLGVEHIHLAVATHAHADHIGGFPSLFQTFSVGTIWYNGQTHTTLTFERFLDAILSSSAVYHEPSRGETVQFNDLTITVLHPEGSAAGYTGHLHDKNIVLRIEFGQFSALLTGDAEEYAEKSILESRIPIGSTVLKLGHHGSRTSTSKEFLQAVSPQMAIYQAGERNSYGHPHREVLSLLSDLDIRTWGTDTYGTLVLVTDGDSFRLMTNTSTTRENQ